MDQGQARTQPIALTIAGSDSGAGAGMQADLKTFAALGVYGTSALTAVTAQNTRGVRAVAELAPALVAAQIDAVVEDIGVDAVKTGMLANAAIIATVAARVQAHGLTPLVVDPVMVATSGDRLLHDNALQALRTLLLPRALIVTPNLPEAAALAGIAVDRRADLEDAARRISALGVRYVLITGGHAPGDPLDLLFDGQGFVAFPGERIRTTSTHGTGLYLVRGHRGPPGAGRGGHGRGRPRQGLCDGGAAGGLPGRPRPRAAAPPVRATAAVARDTDRAHDARRRRRSATRGLHQGEIGEDKAVAQDGFAQPQRQGLGEHRSVVGAGVEFTAFTAGINRRGESGEEGGVHVTPREGRG